MSLLPSEPDPEVDAGPRVIGVDSEDADDVLAALSSRTARELLAELHDDPAPPSALADRVDTSLQNVQYHLEKLKRAGAVEVVDTAYSEKGREMDVYAPADQPLVIFAGDEGESTLRSALSRLLGAVGVLAAASLAVQAVFGRGSLLSGVDVGRSDTGAEGGDAGPAGGGDGGDAGAELAAQDVNETVTETATETPTGAINEATQAATETATQTPAETATAAAEAIRTTAETAGAATGGGLPPGLLFFAGGLVAIAVLAAAVAIR